MMLTNIIIPNTYKSFIYLIPIIAILSFIILLISTVKYPLPKPISNTIFRSIK